MAYKRNYLVHRHREVKLCKFAQLTGGSAKYIYIVVILHAMQM
jgi:hypothetical protein